MNDGQFEWDDAKSAANEVKHGLNFRVAREVFRDFFATERLDDRMDYGEARFAITGMVEGRLIVVVYTMRGDNIRIISARGAEPHEQRRYFEENSR